MNIEQDLKTRSGGYCELCGEQEETESYLVEPGKPDRVDDYVALCKTCISRLTDNNTPQYWRCLEGSIWSPFPSVQALSYRILHSMPEEGWAQDILQSVSPEEEIIEWAYYKPPVAAYHQDAFGNQLENGDTVVLTQALNVKGANFTASKGTVVKRIRLVPDNPEQIEGKIQDQTIVILCKYVKKGN